MEKYFSSLKCASARKGIFCSIIKNDESLIIHVVFEILETHKLFFSGLWNFLSQ